MKTRILLVEDEASISEPLAESLEACRRFPLKRRSRITFEYVLLADVNDTPDDARRLARLLLPDSPQMPRLPFQTRWPSVARRELIGLAQYRLGHYPAATKELEASLECKVYLDLRVKVKSDWRDDERVLDDLGLPRKR